MVTLKFPKIVANHLHANTESPVLLTPKQLSKDFTVIRPKDKDGKAELFANGAYDASYDNDRATSQVDELGPLDW